LGDGNGSLPQAIAAEAILAIVGHWQPRNFLGAPARPGQSAGEFRSAPRTGDAAGSRDSWRICHQSTEL